MANPIVTSLTSYVEEHTLPLIAKSVLGAKSAEMFNLMSGVKGATALNLLDTDVVLQDGSTCGFTASGNTELSQRILNPKVLKVNMEFCEKNLLNTWANYQVKIAAGQKTLPFEQEFTDEIVKSVKAQLEKMIWQGQSGQADSFEGLISIMSNATPAATVTDGTSTPIYTHLKNVYASIPEQVFADDTVILVGMDAFRTFIQELVAANLYHYEANDKDGEYTLPGTTVKVIGVNGLNGTNKTYAGNLRNFYYGVDMNGDEEKFDLWYSQDDRIFKLAIEFLAGVQVAYPSEIVVGSRE